MKEALLELRKYKDMDFNGKEIETVCDILNEIHLKYIEAKGKFNATSD